MTDRDQDLRTQKIWARDAPHYDGWMRRFDRHMLRGGRARLCARAEGRVLEVAVGTGLNLPHYPKGTDLTGVDLSPDMLARARVRAADLGVDATLSEASATRLPFPDDSFDSVVCALALCCIPDDRGAVAEMRRVLAPGGSLLLLDHVISHKFAVRTLQRALEPLTLKLADDHQLRRPLHLVREAGFDVVERERYSLGVIERLVAVQPSPH
ncbi:class I SAM-dependent methyltransferase [Streptomyces sp. NPDC059897]|uniref:class I SAM-dependent methyltransferase n=1 Tax=Streptomyces sp. NPDC059897 TaxID=3346994 RepID=UPI0036622B21